ARLSQEAHDAVLRAGNDPELVDNLAGIEAELRIRRGDLKDAALFLHHDTWAARTGSRTEGALLAQQMLLYIDEGSYDDALTLGTNYERGPAQCGPIHAEIEWLLVTATWRLASFETAHTRADKLRENPDVGTSGFKTMQGKVVDTHGAPVAHARVVAW